MNALLSAVFFGVIEGLTEFLPVSSTGHLIVAERLIGYRDAGETFTIVIQLGAILAVVWFYLRELLEKVGALLQGSPQARRFWLNLMIASLPAALVGLVFEKAIKATLFSPTTVAISLIVGGIILWGVETRQAGAVLVPAAAAQQAVPEPDLYRVTPRQALTIGVAQALAVIPGVSRSGASIVGGLLSGLNRVTATAFSFFLGIPVLGAAGLYSLYKARHTLGQIEGGTPALLIGTAVSFVTALLAVTWLLRYVSRHDFRGFAVYRVVFGALILALVAAGTLR